MVTMSKWSSCLMIFASCACSSSAFTLSSFTSWPTTTAHRPSLISSSPLILSAKPKAKTAKYKQNTRRGGGGFGTTTTTNTQELQSVKKAKTNQSSSSQFSTSPRRLSATEVARQNTAVYAQQQQMELLEKESMKSASAVGAGANPSLRGRRQKWSQRHAAVDLASESGEWKTCFIEEYLQQQQQQQESSKVGQVVQVSQNPLLFTIDGFVDPVACRAIQNDGAGCFHLFYPEKLRFLFDGQESEMDGLLFNTASSKDHPTADPYPDGLHMDTNNQCLFRHVTCILYLNDIPDECGGATVFPLARCLPDDPALTASRRLLAHKLSHTRNHASIQDLGLVADASLIESRVGTNYLQSPETDTAIRIQPKAGRLLVFFSRDSQGQEDPRAWHGGERIIQPYASSDDGAVITEKRILTLFKEVDYRYGSNAELEESRLQQVESTLESFLAPQCEAQRNWLQAKAKLQRALLEAAHANN